MDGSIRLSAKERKACLKLYRSARAARRALVLLLLADEQSYRQIREAALASPDFDRRGETGLPERRLWPACFRRNVEKFGRVLVDRGDALAALLHAAGLRLLPQPLVLRAVGLVAAGTRGHSPEPGDRSPRHAPHGVRLASAAAGRRSPRSRAPA